MSRLAFKSVIKLRARTSSQEKNASSKANEKLIGLWLGIIIIAFLGMLGTVIAFLK